MSNSQTNAAILPRIQKRMAVRKEWRSEKNGGQKRMAVRTSNGAGVILSVGDFMVNPDFKFAHISPGAAPPKSEV